MVISQVDARRNRSSLVRDSNGNKQCRRCDDWKPEEEFSKNISMRDNLNNWCKRCIQGRTKNSKHVHVSWKYRMSPDDYIRKLSDQSNKCPVCLRDFDGDQVRPFIDHDHDCCASKRSCGSCVRGILCGSCNGGLGLFEDDPSRLRMAVKYLEDWKSDQDAIKSR